MNTLNINSILLIEDDQMLVNMYVIKLKKEGFSVDIAQDGIQGLEKIKGKKYDVILLDLMMPEMDGFEVIETLNKSDEYYKAPILVFSNLGQKEDIERAINLGINEEDYIVKANTTPTEVIQKIKSVVKRYHKSYQSLIS